MTTVSHIGLYVLALVGLFHILGVEPLVVYWRRWQSNRATRAMLHTKTVVKLPAPEVRGICGREPGGSFRGSPLVVIEDGGRAMACVWAFGHDGDPDDCLFADVSAQRMAVHRLQTGMVPRASDAKMQSADRVVTSHGRVLKDRHHA